MVWQNDFCWCYARFRLYYYEKHYWSIYHKYLRRFAGNTDASDLFVSHPRSEKARRKRCRNYIETAFVSVYHISFRFTFQTAFIPYPVDLRYAMWDVTIIRILNRSAARLHGHGMSMWSVLESSLPNMLQLAPAGKVNKATTARIDMSCFPEQSRAWRAARRTYTVRIFVVKWRIKFC